MKTAQEDPEALPVHDAPEVVAGPDFEHSQTHVEKEKEAYNHDPPEVDHKAPLREKEDSSKEVSGPRQRRICGLSRRNFVIVLAVSLALLLAVVLGSVLGVELPPKNKDTQGSQLESTGGSQPESTGESQPESTGGSQPSNGIADSGPPVVRDGTGLAVTQPDGSATLYQYYQDTQGRIIENQYSNGEWLLYGSDVPAYAIVATDVLGRSPLAATSWPSAQSGNVYRQLFYLDTAHRVMMSQTTGSNSWSAALNVAPDDTAVAGSIALAVSSDTNRQGLNGIRVYYASEYTGYIQEVGTDFAGPNSGSWWTWASFPDTDEMSGVSTVIADFYNHLYVRNVSTNSLTRVTWNYFLEPETSWRAGEPGPSIPLGSAIAAVNNGARTDYVFYQDETNQLTRVVSQGSAMTDTVGLVALNPRSKLGATYDASISAAVVYYQQAGDVSIAYQGITEGGQKVVSGSVG
ncbi:hypothetical protein LTR37_018565 [Vermiconidia calcicola]|uniref:Uncharacterized protein n=1 Tax=Vermiconidia calcicola TaxID=1690605 RepID=A0ACC3MHX4_9PEZI|nr:hypothetical protein LTR37_018565 [Vermiconidia calcicola]